MLFLFIFIYSSLVLSQEPLGNTENVIPLTNYGFQKERKSIMVTEPRDTEGPKLKFKTIFQKSYAKHVKNKDSNLNSEKEIINGDHDDDFIDERLKAFDNKEFTDNLVVTVFYTNPFGNKIGHNSLTIRDKKTGRIFHHLAFNLRNDTIYEKMDKPDFQEKISQGVDLSLEGTHEQKMEYLKKYIKMLKKNGYLYKKPDSFQEINLEGDKLTKKEKDEIKEEWWMDRDIPYIDPFDINFNNCIMSVYKSLRVLGFRKYMKRRLFGGYRLKAKGLFHIAKKIREKQKSYFNKNQESDVVQCNSEALIENQLGYAKNFNALKIALKDKNFEGKCDKMVSEYLDMIKSKDTKSELKNGTMPLTYFTEFEKCQVDGLAEMIKIVKDYHSNYKDNELIKEYTIRKVLTEVINKVHFSEI